MFWFHPPARCTKPLVQIVIVTLLSVYHAAAVLVRDDHVRCSSVYVCMLFTWSAFCHRHTRPSPRAEFCFSGAACQPVNHQIRHTKSNNQSNNQSSNQSNNHCQIPRSSHICTYVISETHSTFSTCEAFPWYAVSHIHPERAVVTTCMKCNLT